jgi:hypothetical protein
MEDKAYIVIQESSSDKLAWEVNDKMTEGYVPLGGMCVSIAPGGWTLFCQAMVKAGE